MTSLTVSQSSFFVVCSVGYKAYETYMFDTKLLFCHSQVISISQVP